MANLKNPAPYVGTEWWTLDTTAATITISDADDNAIGSFAIQVEGTGWTGEILVQGRIPAAGDSLAWISLAYQNANTGNDVAGGTAISADGLYWVRCDHGVQLNLAYTHTAGTVDVMIRKGTG